MSSKAIEAERFASNVSPEDRDAFLADNWRAVLLDKDALIEKLRHEVRRLNKHVRGLKGTVKELNRLRNEVYRLRKDVAWYREC